MKKIVFAALSAALLVAAPLRADDKDKVDPAYEKKVLKEAEEIEKEVQKIRGLTFQANVRKGVLSENALRGWIQKEIAKPENKTEMDTLGRSARAFGLVPPDFKYTEEVTDFLGDQIGGFYDPDTKMLRLVKKDMGLPAQMAEMNDRIVMAHELEHALQDQNFELRRYTDLFAENWDRSTAWKSVVEGEATLMMMAWMIGKQAPGMEIPDLDGLMGGGMGAGGGGGAFAEEQRKKIEKLPPFVVQNLMVPYTTGAIFVQKVYKKGGWEAVSKLFLDPPSGMHQVLHPNLYFDRVEPFDVNMPRVSKAVKGKYLDGSTLGELNVLLLLQAHGVDEKKAKTLANGWRGDRYELFETQDGKTALVWLSTWEDEAKAQAFAEGYRGGLEKRRGGKFSLERKGTEVLLIDCDDAEIREKVAPKAWASALEPGRLTPIKAFGEKPPASDFTGEPGKDEPKTDEPKHPKKEPKKEPPKKEEEPF